MKKRFAVIIIAFSLSFISMVALSLYTMERFAIFTSYSRQVDHSHLVIQKIYNAEGRLKDLDRSERGYVLTHDSLYIRPFNNTIDSLRSVIAILEDILSDNPEQSANVKLLKGSVALRINYGRSNIEYVDSSHTSVPSPFYHIGRKYMQEASRKLREMHKMENDLLAERFKQEEFYEQLTNDTITYLLFVFCMITLILFSLMIKELRSRVRFQEELQGRVMDLKRSHSELQEIAYAASHDLQEPLRKIQVFSNMMLYQKSTTLEEADRSLIQRISNSASRMQLLIGDLISLTNLTNTHEGKSRTDLNRTLQYILIDISDSIEEKNAKVEVRPLPIIDGYEQQLKILFRALLDNALKFAKEGVPPEIKLNCTLVKGDELADINPNIRKKNFYKITCEDNGIGFDNQYITKMFRIFQRLHADDSQYEGKGIGLAICQRIMANHEGYIKAESQPQQGACFQLYFPIGE